MCPLCLSLFVGRDYVGVGVFFFFFSSSIEYTLMNVLSVCAVGDAILKNLEIKENALVSMNLPVWVAYMNMCPRPILSQIDFIL